MRKFTFLLPFFFLRFTASAQYDIKINFKGCTDTTVYLVVHMWESNNIVDSCKKIKNGQIQFKGKTSLTKGQYILVNQEKNTTLFEFLVDDSQKFTISADKGDITRTLKCSGSKENELLFEYNKFFADKNVEFDATMKEAKKMKKEDSAAVIQAKIKKLNEDVKTFEPGYKERIKGTFLENYFNIQKEKQAPTDEIPKASNGRPDSIYAYYWYKNHFWDGIDLKDDRYIHTPYLDDRIKKYFDQVIVQHPDTIIKGIDLIMGKCEEGSLTYKMLLGHFTYKYENVKTITFDKNGNTITMEKVFIHMSDAYISKGKAKGVYAEETVPKIIEKANNNRNILPGAVAPDIYVIDTIGAKKVIPMKFDTCKSSSSITRLYEMKAQELTPLWRSLHQVEAKYTVLVFWASDCGHCQTDIPKLNDTLQTIKGRIDFKVFGVQTKDDYDAWKKFIIEHKLDFINVYDPVHINNYKQKFDVETTPVIYILDKNKVIKAKKISSKQVVEMLEIFEKIDKDQQKK